MFLSDDGSTRSANLKENAETVKLFAEQVKLEAEAVKFRAEAETQQKPWRQAAWLSAIVSIVLAVNTGIQTSFSNRIQLEQLNLQERLSANESERRQLQGQIVQLERENSRLAPLEQEVRSLREENFNLKLEMKMKRK